MDFNAIIKRVINIITKPKGEWEVIKNESMTVSSILVPYAIILAAIPAVFGLLGNALIGRSIMGFTIRIPMGRALIWSIVVYALSIGATYLMAIIIDALAPSFGSSKDMTASLKVAVFSMTAYWVAGAFYLIPAIEVLALVASLYSLFLLFMGLKIIKNPPADKAVAYFVVVIVANLILSFLIGFLAGRIAFGEAAGFM